MSFLVVRQLGRKRNSKLLDTGESSKKKREDFILLVVFSFRLMILELLLS